MRRLFRKEYSRDIAYTIIAVIIAVIFLFPVYWILISSLKSDQEIFSRVQTWWPKKIHLENYIDQILNKTKTANLPVQFRNSGIIATGSMILSLILSIPASYGISKFNIPGKKPILLTFLVTQMLPASLILTPLFLIFSKAGILNSYLAPILATATISIPFVIMVLRPIFLAYPHEIEEAALIDGCNQFTAFLKVTIPVCKSGIITAAAFSFIYGWNDLIYSITFNNKADLLPMTSGIYQFMDAYGTQWNMIMAYGVITELPIIVLFVALQKHIVGGLAGGAVKG
ncbi:MAG: carbohydrate ABC transporter permease [Dorea sp.]|jgi:multiple sugar transport system permease protein|nr:carbohydrate ABC transporter permease [Dorea sp.]